MRRILFWLLAVGLVGMATTAATTTAKKGRPSPRRSAAKKRARKKKLPPRPLVDPTAGDNVDGDDLPVRRAAVEALGNYNGSVVAVDPDTGRVLTIVNQRLAYRSGFVPCSTIKLVTSLAALSEGVVERDTQVRISRRLSMNLTTALAHSNNTYFSILGSRLGFERVSRYARMFGLGERAGLEISGEQAGLLPPEPPANGGVGMMTSFGEGIAVTPLELAALVSVISNGGTLYYLQYPRSQKEIDEFAPRVKRSLEVHPWINDVKIGMRAAVEFGTARRAGYDNSEPILGKTGTCTDFRSSNHMGWFASFNEAGHHRLVVVVMLTGGHPVNGPVAAGVAGQVYRQLTTQNYFAADTAPVPQILSTQSCCAR